MTSNHVFCVRSSERIVGDDNSYLVDVGRVRPRTQYRVTFSGFISVAAATELQVRSSTLTRHSNTSNDGWCTIAILAPTQNMSGVCYFSENPTVMEVRFVLVSTGEQMTNMAQHSFNMHLESIE
jgi:hypothetical protein